MSQDQKQPAQPDGERMELRHEAVPGYATVFYVVLAIGVFYLAAVVFFGNGGAH